MTQLTTTAAPRPAFDTLYEEYREPLFRYARARMREASTEEIRDLVADVWLKIYEALPEWEDRGLPIGSWLYRSMRNMIVDWIRARKGRDTVSFDPDIHDAADSAAEDEHLDVLSSEIMDEILEILTGQQGELVRLVYVEGWRLADVSQLHGESLDATKKMHRRALGRIKTYLETGVTRRKRRARVA
jgi:RNA polymerase sigma-70 factor (ECF subfamily)